MKECDGGRRGCWADATERPGFSFARVFEIHMLRPKILAVRHVLSQKLRHILSKKLEVKLESPKKPSAFLLYLAGWKKKKAHHVAAKHTHKQNTTCEWRLSKKKIVQFFGIQNRCWSAKWPNVQSNCTYIQIIGLFCNSRLFVGEINVFKDVPDMKRLLSKLIRVDHR